MPKQIKKDEFIESAKNNTRNVVAKQLNISDMTAQRIADEIGVQFKKYKPTGRKKIKII